nr:DUF6221 family protein [Mycobacterium sp. 1245499.0]
MNQTCPDCRSQRIPRLSQSIWRHSNSVARASGKGGHRSSSAIRAALSAKHRGEGSRRGLSTRGLRETAFKRRLVDDALRGVSWNFARGEDGEVHAKKLVLGQLAMIYADHPDFDARWVS